MAELTLAESYVQSNSFLPFAAGIADCYVRAMDIKQIRQARLRWLVDTFHKVGGFAALADKVGKEPNYYSQINTGHRNMGHNVARELESLHGLPHGTMDRPVAEPLSADQIRAIVNETLAGVTAGPVKRRPQTLRRRASGEVVQLRGRGNPKEDLQTSDKEKKRKRGSNR